MIKKKRICCQENHYNNTEMKTLNKDIPITSYLNAKYEFIVMTMQGEG